MIRNLIFAAILVFSLVGGQGVNANGYELKVRIKNLANKEIILGHRFADKLYPDDTLKLDNSGFGVLKGDKQYPEGIYFLLTPSKKLVDFFLTENQKFSLETDTIELYDKLKFENSPENTAAIEYRRYITIKQKELTDAKEQKKDVKEEEQQFAKDAKTKTDKFIESQKSNLVGVFFKAVQEITIPDPPKDANGKILDSLFQARYYRTHYFDNIDLKDTRLLRTSVYDEKIKNYLNRVIPQIPDTVNMEIDKLMTIAQSDKDIFRYMLITMFNYAATSQIMGFDAVFTHVAEKWYLPKATFEDTAFIRKTRETVEKLKPLLIGETAPDVQMMWVPSDHFTVAASDSIARDNPHIGSMIKLSQINSKYTILAFWESDCHHCQKAIPELYEVYKKLKNKGVKVMSVHMLGGIEGKRKWINFVNEHAMYDWMNVWNPYNFEYKKTYDISITPAIFVLDKDKKIIAKKIDPSQIEMFLNLYEKTEAQKVSAKTK
jgi:thiol-disulfide isomerase/thioredoxin